MSWIQKVAIFGVAEIDDSALLGLSIRVGDFHAMVAEALFHAADPVESHEALVEGFGLVVPAFAGVRIVREICGEAVGHLRGTVYVAGDGLVADVGLGHLEVFCYLEALQKHYQQKNKESFAHDWYYKICHLMVNKGTLWFSNRLKKWNIFKD